MTSFDGGRIWAFNSANAVLPPAPRRHGIVGPAGQLMRTLQGISSNSIGGKTRRSPASTRDTSTVRKALESKRLTEALKHRIHPVHRVGRSVVQGAAGAKLADCAERRIPRSSSNALEIGSSGVVAGQLVRDSSKHRAQFLRLVWQTHLPLA